MIELQHITKSYNAGTPLQVDALQDVNITFQPGSFTLLIGSNGSGKSTLLNILAGAERPDSGALFINSKNLSNQPIHQRAKLVARIFQNPILGTAQDLSLIDNFRLAALRTQTKGLRLGINQAFRKLVAEHVSVLEMGLEKRLDQKMSSFSGGQRQALSLLMATFDKLELLLLDEPTAALDPKSANIVFNLTQQIVREKKLTALMVTHDLNHCLKPVDRIIQMNQGKIVRDVIPDVSAPLKLANVYDWFEGNTS